MWMLLPMTWWCRPSGRAWCARSVVLSVRMRGLTGTNGHQLVCSDNPSCEAAGGLRVTIGLVLKIAVGLVCFVIGAASLIGAISSFLFVSASDAHIPAMFGAFGAMFLWFTYLLLRQVRWHND